MRWSAVAVAAAMLAAGSGAVTPAIGQAGRQAVMTRAVAAGAGVADAGALPGSQTISLVLTLKPTDERAAALDHLLAAQTTPSSAEFHRWLTPAEFAAQYGATSVQLGSAKSWAEASGLSIEAVSPAGTRIRVAGPASAIEQAFAVKMHLFTVEGAQAFGNVGVPSLPVEMAGVFSAIEGLNTLPAGKALEPAVTFEALAGSVDANQSGLLAAPSALSSRTMSAAELAEYSQLFRQAAAQGITVLSASGKGDVPAALPEVTAVAMSGDALIAAAPVAAQPAWQTAPGLPADHLRHIPDVTVASLAAFEQTLQMIAAGSRLGNINPVLYALAPTPGLFGQSGSVAAGTWMPATGLGTLDLDRLAKVYPRGAGSSFASFAASNYSPNHGQGTSFTSVVTSGTGGPTPTGTVAFVTAGGTTLATVALSGGSASYSTNALDSGTYILSAVYSGDAVYAAAKSPTSQIYVGPEPSNLSAAVSANAVVGSSFNVTVTDMVTLGQPSGSVSVALSGTTQVYTATLVPAGANSSSANVTIPSQAPGTITLSITCSTSTNYSCQNPLTTTATIAKATPTLSISYSPNPPVSGANVVLNAVVGTVGSAPAPTGNVRFFDNGTLLNASSLSGGTTTTTGTVPTTATHSITATYDGDSNYLPVSTTAGSTTSGTISTTTQLIASASSVTAGQAITFTAVITPASTGPAAPGGNVQFFDGGTLLGTANVSGNTAAFAVSTLSPAVAHSITAVYSGDGYYATSLSNAVPLGKSTAPVATTTALTASSSNVVAGQSITFTAAVTPASAGGPALTGTVQFLDGSTLIGSAPISGSGASFSTALLAPGAAHTVTAVYSGDNNYSASTSPGVNVGKNASLIATATALVASATTVQSGRSITFSASIAPASAGSAVPSGSVQFFDGGALIGTSPVAGNGASFSTALLSATASHAITATYTGDGLYAASTSPIVTVGANTATTATVTTLTVSTNTAATGAPVTLSAVVTPTVNGIQPTGTLQFYDGNAVVCTTALSGSAGSCVLTNLPAGANSITAVYVGDSNYTASTSAAAVVTITNATPTVATLIASVTPATVPAGGMTTLTIMFTAPNGFAPVGMVNATISGTNAVVFATTFSGTALTYPRTLTGPINVPATPGVYNVTVSCTGTNFSCTPVVIPITSTSVTGKTPTTTVLTSTASSGTAGSTVLTATVTTMATGAAAPSGTVSFFDGTTPLATAPVTALTTTSAATATVILAPGTHSLTAVYSGDTTYAPSTSAAVTGTGTAVAGAISLTASATSGLAGLNVLLTARVTGQTAAGASPTGLVSFYLAGPTPSLLGTSSLTNGGAGLGVATFSTTGLPAGTSTVFAVYAGDLNFTTLTSTSITLGFSDYNLTFLPQSLTLTRGQAGQSTLILGIVNGFAGTVVFGCTPPPNTEITCSFSPTTLSGGGTTTMTLRTVAPKSSATIRADSRSAGKHPGRVLGGLSLAALCCLLLPARRRRVPVLLVVLLGLALMPGLGCSDDNFNGPGPTGTLDPGTPLGTVNVIINTAGTDGVNTVRHNYSFQVTVQ